MNDDRLRIDKWLWYARFLKSRSQAADLVETGEVTVNGAVVTRTAHALKPGDMVGVRLRKRRRLVRVLALGARRGPASEAQALYEELPVPALEEESASDA